MGLLIITTLPSILILTYFVKGDKFPEPQDKILKTFFWGLAICLPAYIGNTLLFEQNTAATRNRFINQVNPFLESIQQRQGLFAYRVVMDDTNNTADVIDRNQMVGQIFIQPTKTAEYIILDFNVTPTGVEF